MFNNSKVSPEFMKIFKEFPTAKLKHTWGVNNVDIVIFPRRICSCRLEKQYAKEINTHLPVQSQQEKVGNMIASSKDTSTTSMSLTSFSCLYYQL